MPTLGRRNQRRAAETVVDRKVRVVRQQHLQHGGAARHPGYQHRRIRLIIDRTDVGPEPDQHPRGRLPVRRGRQQQRGAPPPIVCLQIGPRPHRQSDQVGVTGLGGTEQRGRGWAR